MMDDVQSRIERIDAALAKQLQRSIEANSALRNAIIHEIAALRMSDHNDIADRLMNVLYPRHIPDRGEQ